MSFPSAIYPSQHPHPCAGRSSTRRVESVSDTTCASVMRQNKSVAADFSVRVIAHRSPRRNTTLAKRPTPDWGRGTSISPPTGTLPPVMKRTRKSAGGLLVESLSSPFSRSATSFHSRQSPPNGCICLARNAERAGWFPPRHQRASLVNSASPVETRAWPVRRAMGPLPGASSARRSRQTLPRFGAACSCGATGASRTARSTPWTRPAPKTTGRGSRPTHRGAAGACLRQGRAPSSADQGHRLRRDAGADARPHVQRVLAMGTGRLVEHLGRFVRGPAPPPWTRAALAETADTRELAHSSPNRLGPFIQLIHVTAQLN
jgi:hypothetical protein